MKAKWFVQVVLVVIVLLIVGSLSGHRSTVNAQATAAATAPAAPPAGKMRWDIISVTAKDNKQNIDPGGVAFASANDGSYIKFTGTGTYGPGASDPVTGGGDWATWDAGNKPTGGGKYTVTAFAGFDWTPG